MGKFKRKNAYKDKKDPKKKVKNGEGEYSTSEFVKENTYLETFYKFQLQNEFKTESEFKQFMNILRERLPITFRINDNVPNYQNFLNKIKDKDFITKTLGSTEGEKTIEPKKEGDSDTDSDSKASDQLKLFPVPWDPRQLIWQMNTFRHELKKNEALKSLHKLINQASESGLITRQELVSMLPPLLLDIQGTDMVFDMCAAPGSKTSQMLEILYRDEVAGKGLTQGGIVANDVDTARANMLIHQVQRISTAGMLVANHGAQYFPALKDESAQGGKFQFDKILCDVPCSGDGAIRKIPQKWQKWKCSDGTSLHPLQLQIVMRALQLVKVGGLVLYSTCSINPIEDEAVITELFRRIGDDDAIELLDISEKLPDLIARKGLYSWHVCDPKDIKTEESKVPEGTEKKEALPSDLFNIYDSADQLPKDYSGLIRPGMFPDTLERMRDKIQIQKTVRLMPHDQNTGGFYLALIRKKKHVVFSHKSRKARKEEEEKSEVETKVQDEEQAIRELDQDVQNIPKEILATDGEDKPVVAEQKEDKIEEEEAQKDLTTDKEKTEGKDNAPKEKKKDKQPKKPMYVELSNEDWEWVRDHYGFTDESLRRLFIQQNEGDKKILYVSPGIRKVLDLDKDAAILKLNMGVKALSRNRDAFLDNKFPFRICQDAILTLFPYMSKRTVKCSAADFAFFVQNPSVKYENIPNPELRKEIQAIGHGSFVLYCEKDGLIQDRDCIVCLNHANSVTPMVSKELFSSFKIRYVSV